jgi:predicted nucleic acid-binding protein
MDAVIAVDTSAAIDYLRSRPAPPQIDQATQVFVPLPVIGELFYGALGARDREAEVTTARTYADIRIHRKLNPVFTGSLRNDLWIAAVCLQHRLPLLTNDRGFDAVPNLAVLHW